MSKVLASPFLRYGALIVVSVCAVALIFPGFVHNLFSSNEFMPHATCYMRNPKMIALHVSSDMLIGLAYVSISSTLAFLVYKASKDIPFHWMFLAFGLFIVSCGFTHFMEVWTVWSPVYWLAGYVKVITAIASVVTAIALFPLVPRVFGLINSVKVSEQRRQDLVIAHDRLTTQKSDLEAANRELETFNYSVAHDLRAPLRGMQGFATILQNEHSAQLNDTAKKYLNRIATNAEKMDSLLSDLLAYSKVSRGGVDVTTVELRPVLDQAITAVTEAITRRNARIEADSANISVRANATILAQVFTNLLSNAVKFVPANKTPVVNIRITEDTDTVRIAVSDNGIGIPPQHFQKIFRLFERLHLESEYPGTGIGLAIVQRGVEKINGQVHVESEMGKGSTFTVVLQKA